MQLLRWNQLVRRIITTLVRQSQNNSAYANAVARMHIAEHMSICTRTQRVGDEAGDSNKSPQAMQWCERTWRSTREHAWIDGGCRRMHLLRGSR
jgi:hypothetical protein